MNYTGKNHTFAICAYKESPFLEECIQSLLGQTIPSTIIIVTSTDNAYIQNMAEKYHLELFINHGESGITQDWMFAYRSARTELMTGAIVNKNTLLKVKRTMLLPLHLKIFHNSIFVRRRVLSFGCPICCPSVTFVKDNLPDQIFFPGFRSDEDWQAWELLSRKRGAFVYCNRILMYHRIHDGSETSAILGDSARGNEDFQMFCKFWPKPIARLLTRAYSSSEKSNYYSRL